MELSLFEHVADALRGLLPDELGTWGYRAHRHGIKVWFDEQASREHYEAQVVSRRLVDGEPGRALEIGFHAEQPSLAANEAVLARLVAAEERWRPVLGDEAAAGPFFGRPEDWRRLSEAWIEPDLDEPDIVMSVASRLTDYIEALEPLRRAPA